MEFPGINAEDLKHIMDGMVESVEKVIEAVAKISAGVVLSWMCISARIWAVSYVRVTTEKQRVDMQHSGAVVRKYLKDETSVSR